MARRVAVDLTLDAKNYIASAAAAKKETSGLDREMDQLDRSVNKVERELKELTANAAVAAKSVDNLGDQSRQAAADMRILEARIDAAKKSVRGLGEEFARTGDAAIGKSFAQEKSLLSRLERLKKMLEPPESPKSWLDSKVNLPFAPPLPAGVIAGGVGLIGAAGPMLAAMLGGIIVGGVGAGGVVGGAILAARDPRVKQAWGDLGQGLLTELNGVTDAFVEPMVDAANVFERAFGDAKIVETLKEAANLVDPLTKGVAGFTVQIGAGLNYLIRNAGPVFNVLMHDLPEFGRALSSGFTSLGKTAKEGALGLHDLFTVMNEGTLAVAGFAGMLAKIYPYVRPSFFLDNMDLFLGPWGALAKNQNKSAGALDPQQTLNDLSNVQGGASGPAISKPLYAFDAATGQMRDYASAVSQAEYETRLLELATGDLYHEFLDFESASVNAEEAIDNLADSLAENGLNFDKDTEAGRKNVRNLVDVAQSAEDATRKKLAETHSVEEATDVYETYRQKMYDMLIAAGATAEVAQALTDKWLGLQNLQDIAKTMTIYVRSQIDSQTKAYLSGSDNVFLKGYASGGSTDPYKPFVTGENGPELQFPGGRSQYIATKEQMAREWRPGSTSWGGGDRTITVVVKDTSGRTLRRELITDATGRNVSDSEIRAAYP